MVGCVLGLSQLKPSELHILGLKKRLCLRRRSYPIQNLPFEVVSRYRDPQFQVTANVAYY